MSELCQVEPGKRSSGTDQPVIKVSERVPGERARIVVQGRSTENGSQCTVIVIHEEDGSWAIHGLGNQGVRLTSPEMAVLTETILKRIRSR